MTKKLQNISVSLLIAILFALLFQSVHSYEHLAREFSEEHCEHKYAGSQTEFSHSHHDFDHCFVCEFSFGNAVTPTFFSLPLSKTTALKWIRSSAPEQPDSFCGSFFSLRAPPCFIA